LYFVCICGHPEFIGEIIKYIGIITNLFIIVKMRVNLKYIMKPEMIDDITNFKVNTYIMFADSNHSVRLSWPVDNLLMSANQPLKTNGSHNST